MGSTSNNKMDIDFNSMPKKLVKKTDNFPSTVSQNTNNKQTVNDVAESKEKEASNDTTNNNQQLPPSVPKTIEVSIVGSSKDFDGDCAISFDEDVAMEIDWRTNKLIVTQDAIKWTFNEVMEDKNNLKSCICHYETLLRIGGEDKFMTEKRWAKIMAQVKPFTQLPYKVVIRVPITLRLLCVDCEIEKMLNVPSLKKLYKLQQETEELKNPKVKTKTSKQNKKDDLKALHQMAFLGNTPQFGAMMHNNDNDGVLFDGKNAATMDYPKNNNGVLQYLQAQAQAQHGAKKKKSRMSPVEQQSLQWAMMQSKMSELIDQNKKLRNRIERRGKSSPSPSRSRSRSRNRDSD